MSKEEILEYFKDIDGMYNECTRYDDLKKMLSNLEEVKRGHWINKGFEPTRCSVCGITVDAINGIPWAIKSFKYCPHCGAKMDEVEE